MTIALACFHHQELNRREHNEGKRKMPENHSEVARLLAQIDREYEAAQNGFTGLASGMSSHQFITARMERISDLHTSLQTLIGESATAVLTEHFIEQKEGAGYLAGRDV